MTDVKVDTGISKLQVRIFQGDSEDYDEEHQADDDITVPFPPPPLLCTSCSFDPWRKARDVDLLVGVCLKQDVSTLWDSGVSIVSFR